MQEEPLILKLASKISDGDWYGITNNFTIEQLSDGADMFCHAALLAENSVEAEGFMQALIGRLVKYVQPDMRAMLQQTWERLQEVREAGGWLAPDKEVQTEDAIVNTFPTDVFPPMLERYCNSVVQNVQVDRAMIGAAVLATSALCMQGRYMVAYPSGNGHGEHLCLYVVIVGSPGERKTSVFRKALAPVYAWQKERSEAYKQELAEYNAKAKILHNEAETLNRQTTKKETTDAKKSQLQEELTACEQERMDLLPPVSPYILVGDTTVEALSNLMELTGETAGVFTDEADFFKIIAGLYNKGQTGNIGLVLDAYDGTQFNRTRGNGAIWLKRPLLSMCLFTQPNLFEATQENAELQGRGMVGRLLFCEPTSMVGRRDVRCNVPIDMEALRDYTQLLTEFLDMEQKDNETIPVIRWEPDAAEAMLDYLQMLEDSMKAGCPMENATDYASKAGGVAVRITGILHLLFTKGTSDRITLETAKRAIRMHSYFFTEKMRNMQSVETHETQLLQKVAEKLCALTISQEKAYTTKRDLQQSLKKVKSLCTAKKLEPILETMQDKSLIDLYAVPKSKKKILYVSPYLWQFLDSSGAD